MTEQQSCFRVVKGTLHAASAWDFHAAGTDTCGICRSNLNDLCIACETSSSSSSSNAKSVIDPGATTKSDVPSSKADAASLRCRVEWGTCGHAFHHHCLKSWLRHRVNCPLDGSLWVPETLVPRELHRESGKDTAVVQAGGSAS